jgi:GMP synthase (glutamine-hydrolysing)
MENINKNFYGVQFHPEVTHTEYGMKILSNFVFNVCKCDPDWKMEDFAKSSIEKYKKELADKRVLLGLSGGLDSSVVALLLHKAIGKNLICVFVDHGLLRKDEGDYVEKIFKDKFDVNLIRVDAKDRFLTKLKGITEPEAKRKIIGKEFIEVFRAEAKKIGNIDVLSQGTIYPDVIESGKGSSAVIKSHHNVGGLPKDIGFKSIVEPLRDLFKDEVRAIGLELGLPEELVYRQPFPGPGLAVRIVGEITEEKIKIAQDTDAILREEFKKAGLDKTANQYFTVVTNTQSVGVMGDARTYGYTLALRAVTTDDFMTATWTRVPYEILEHISSRITNEVKGINRVTYDITSKPPATVEWE